MKEEIKCPVTISFTVNGDEYGQVFRCELETGHKGKHRESGTSHTGKHLKRYVIEWEVEK